MSWSAGEAHMNGDCGSFCAACEAEDALEAESRDVPCERCVFVPTPTGACICRPTTNEESS